MDLPTDARIVTSGSATWTGTSALPVVDEVTYAYDRPVAESAVTEAAHTTGCQSYSARDSQADLLGAFAMTRPSGSGALASLCEKLVGDNVVCRCIVTVGHGDIARSMRVWDGDLVGSQRVAQDLLPTLRNACFRTGPSPTP